MALLPSRQFSSSTATFVEAPYSAFSRFHAARLLFFRHNSPIYFKSHKFCSAHDSLVSYSSAQQSPRRKSRSVLKSKPFSHCNPTLNMCRSRWLDKWNEPHQQNRPKLPRPVLSYRSSGNFLSSDFANIDNSSGNSGRSNSGSSTMDKIMEKLKKVGYEDDVNEGMEETSERSIEKGSIEDIFYVEEGMLPNTRGGFSAESPYGLENVFGSNGKARFPWEKPKEDEEQGSVQKKSRTSLAELTLPASELVRLRNLAFRTKSKTRIKGAGVTQTAVDAIHEKWKTSEIVRLKIEGPSALNMKRMHEILERKTGGLVIWRSGTSVSLYRGVSYEDPSVQLKKRTHNKTGTPHNYLATATDKTIRDFSERGSDDNIQRSRANSGTTAEEQKDAGSLPVVKYENEVDKLLDGLGPRYADWPGCDPLPVDADMLLGIVPGYQPPFRILPYGVRSTLRRTEETALRRLARVLPPHFALGRNRQLQGLAIAMIKLWEKSSIAKVALKRGVQLTTSERMAEEIKKLTGGILLSRNKDFLVFYRGKNFLSPDVAEALLERETLANALQDDEEQARLRASALVVPNVEIVDQSRTAGTLGETMNAEAQWGKRLDDDEKEKLSREAEVMRHANLVRKLERKLAFAERKLRRGERALFKVELFLKPKERQADPESITDEERFMFRKLGLRMKAFLLLGRRGVFDGTVENMHLHWKYRELVKIIVKAKNFEQVRKIALALEAESGGVLVSVDRVSKGYAIVVFRGKDYQRPSTLRPKNLLTKRKALARSIELQRREALYSHISALRRRAEKLRSELEQMEIVKDRGDKQLYDKLDFAYPSDDELSEEEGDENENENEKDNLIQSLHSRRNVPHDVVNREIDSELRTYDSDTEEEDDESGENSTQGLHLETGFPYNTQKVGVNTVPEACENENEQEDESDFSIPNAH